MRFFTFHYIFIEIPRYYEKKCENLVKSSKIPYYLRKLIHDSICSTLECNRRTICNVSWTIDLKSLYLNQRTKSKFYLDRKSFSWILLHVFRKWLLLKGFRLIHYRRKRCPNFYSSSWWKPQFSSSFRSWAIAKIPTAIFFLDRH